MKNYKLEHKTIGFGIDQITRLPTQGISGRFIIPSYQRGYRWTADEATKLLNDIWDSQGKPYSLQPIVVKDLGEGAWELIDGQQRLTTLWLILRFMDKGELRYSLEYQTRLGSQAYLNQIDADKSKDNIDYFHIHEVYHTIIRWFEEKMGASYRQFLIDEFFRYLSTSVRVIWYEVPKTEDSIQLFTRLNQGRIPLTDSELIKAVLLTNVQQAKPGRETEVAAQWDGMERDLQRDEIWAFIANKASQNPRQYGTRIDLLLDVLAKKPSLNAPRYHTFDTLHEGAQSNSFVFWDEVVALHAQILGWFEEPHWYNRIGFLVACGTPLSDIFQWVLGKENNYEKKSPPTKSEFKTILNNRIRSLLDIPNNNIDVLIDDLRYHDAKAYNKLQQVLLLFNVAISRERFPFEKHVGENWTLEHIHAQNAQNLNRADQWAAWLADHNKALLALKPKSKEDIDKILDDINTSIKLLHTSKFGQDQFKNLAGRILLALNNDVVDEPDHSIANLALLSNGANAAMSNSVFEVKRNKVLEMDKGGHYIPAATRNVFLKYYSSAENLQPHFWSEADKINYSQAIKDKIANFLQ